ncbi:hypothetical protein B0H16DRAFT_1252350, partial [Mycena metata]
LQPPKMRANHKVKPILTPADLHDKKLVFDGIERDPDVLKRCGIQVLYLKDKQGQLVKHYLSSPVRTFPEDVIEGLRSHHHRPSRCHAMKRGAQFDFYSAGNMTAHGSTAPMGGAPGSGYAPVAGFDATMPDGIDLIFDEIEASASATCMMTVMKVFHHKAYNNLMEHSQNADCLGKSGTNIYKCRCYCAPQHSDNDPCTGLCMQTELYALPWEYAFCQPSYGYYL